MILVYFVHIGVSYISILKLREKCIVNMTDKSDNFNILIKKHWIYNKWGKKCKNIERQLT